MNKVININFQGRILPIEEVAYETLKQYIETLRYYFENEEGRDEIINDIECRIAELCDERLKKGEACITEGDIQLIIESIGRPADFEAQDGFKSASPTNEESRHQKAFTSSMNEEHVEKKPKRLYRDEQNKVLGGVCSGIANYFGLDPVLIRVLWVLFFGVSFVAYLILWIAVPSSAVKEVGGVRKRLFRDADNKIIAGVCSGLAKYFGVNVWVPRVLFILPFFSFIFKIRHAFFWNVFDLPDFIDFTFSPGALFIYIVLWLILPEAVTAGDKLEMKGEKVDLENIKNTIQRDTEGFSKRAESWGKDISKKWSSTSKEENSELAQGTGCFYYIGRTITILFKAFVYFFLGIIVLALLATLFGFGVVTTGMLPLQKFILEDGWQHILVWVALLFFIWVPVIGIVTAIIRKIAGIKKSNYWVRTSLWVLWIVGLISFVLASFSISGNFSKRNRPVEESVVLQKANVSYLELTALPKMKYYEHRLFRLEPFNFYNEDTVYVRNLRIRIIQSKSDSFEVKIVKLSNGPTIEKANTLAQKINFDLKQEDSLLFLDKGIAITQNDKFRNQHVIMTIAVPVGKRIKISKKGWEQVNVSINGQGIQSETMGDFNTDHWQEGWDSRYDDESYSYERGVEYMMTASGLEKIRRDDEEETENRYHSDSPDELEQQLRELNEERKKIEEDLKLSREERLKEVEKIDRALEKKKDESNEKKKNKSTTNSVNAVVDVANNLGDLQWVVERFTY